MLAVVENEQQPAVADEIGERLERRLPGKGADIECGGDGILDVIVAGESGELDESGTLRVPLLDPAGELEDKPRLSRSARARERQQPRSGE